MRLSSKHAGFTLIEVMVVVVIIGLLAAIAIPKFTDTKSRAFVTTQKSDLSNLAMQQELFYNTGHVYGASAAQVGVTPSTGVTLNILEATGAGWSASTSHSGTTQQCAVFYGNAAAVSPATQPGVIDCQ